MAQQAIGMIETRGLIALVEATDAMLKSANVELVGPMTQVGNAMVTVCVTGDVAAVKAALDAGALGYLQKSASRDELLAALQHVARGVRSLPPEVDRRLAALRLGPAITPREREILALIAAGRANKEIAAELGVSEDTVKRHVSHILEKLDVNDRAQATAEAIRRGIVKMPE